MRLTIHPEHPQPRLIKQVADCLAAGGIIIYPTDTIYGLGCDIFHPKAIERIARIKQVDPQKAQLSFVCSNLSDLSQYTKSISTPLYRTLKNYLPGPYTFILPASKQVPKLLHSKKNTIGLRIPDHPIALAIVEATGRPLLSASLPGDDPESIAQPDEIYQRFHSLVDMIIDGGPGGVIPSTIIDCNGSACEVIRQGAGTWEDN